MIRCIALPLVFFGLLTPPATTADNGALAALDRDLQALRQELDIPALAVVVVDGQRVLLSKTYGVAARKSGKPFDEQHYFRVGSITKTFTALAALRLVQDDRLTLDGKLYQIAPGLPFENPWREQHPVTVAQLMEHTAGFNDLTIREFDFNRPLPTRAALELSPGSRRVRWPPGLHHSYSNIGPGLLAAAIEQLAGPPFHAVLHEAVLEPLGMQSATLLPTERVLARLVTGYDSDGTTPIPYWHMTYPAFGALNLQPGDMAPFLQLFLNRGRHGDRRFLSEGMIDRMETPRTTLAARAGLRFGYGLGLYAFLHDSHVFYGHGGDADGYLSRFGYQKEAGLAYFVGINVFRGNDLRQVRRRVERYIVAGLPAPRPPMAAAGQAVLESCTGAYETVTWRFPNAPAAAVSPERIVVLRRGDRLFLSGRGKPERRLIPVAERLFRFPGQPVATLACIEYDGARYLQMDGGNFRRVPPP